jgi:hypothetical protein
MGYFDLVSLAQTAVFGAKRRVILASGLALVLLPATANARTVFLNGTDISAARSQEIKNVTVQIDEKGDVYIIAPQYQAVEEHTYLPLSKYVQGLNKPSHQAAQKLPDSDKMVGAMAKIPAGETTAVNAGGSGMIEKAGTSTTSAAAAAAAKETQEKPADEKPGGQPAADAAKDGAQADKAGTKVSDGQ